MAKNTIILKSYSNVIEEYRAGGDIYPGCFVKLNASGQVVVADGSEDAYLPMVAIEDALQGKGINDKFETGDLVRCWIPQRGDQVYAVLADGHDVAIGTIVTLTASGYVREMGGATDLEIVVGVALEKVEASSTGGFAEDGAFLEDNSRLIIRVI